MPAPRFTATLHSWNGRIAACDANTAVGSNGQLREDEFSCGPASVFLARLEREGVRLVWLVGDIAALYGDFTGRKIDRIELSMVPVVSGQGSRSLQQGAVATWELDTVESFPS